MTPMNHVTVEPAPETRSALASWLLSRDPRVQTVSTGFLVALDLYAEVPSELLEGAYVDGYRYRHVIEGMVPDGRGYRLADAPKGRTKDGAPRKRRAPRQHPTGSAVTPSAPKDDVTTDPDAEVSE